MSENPRLLKRRMMNHRDADRLLRAVSSFGFSEKHGKLEEAETEDGAHVYLQDGDVVYFGDGDSVYPTLRCPCINSFPTVVVDMGAIPFICKGADVMAPGIKEMTPGFDAGALVVVRDINHRKALALGKALKSSSEIEASKKGKVIQNLHYVGDKVWGLTSD